MKKNRQAIQIILMDRNNNIKQRLNVNVQTDQTHFYYTPMNTLTIDPNQTTNAIIDYMEMYNSSEREQILEDFKEILKPIQIKKF